LPALASQSLTGRS